ncbi:CHAD domain-containing protein [Pyruvatibacter mobilis]|uniref:CYTH and CHAD domain-containing protein n=1 Tax=Pyruvatibacter mobilis TaxID=1712261 RepID=UPI003BA8908A
MKPVRRELELKLSVTPETLARIRKGGALARLASLTPVGRASTKRLHSVYWDTSAHDLAAAGIGLRIRDAGGTLIQTLKTEDEGAGLATDRAEDETVISDAPQGTSPASWTPDLRLIADKALRRRARMAIGKQPLQPLFESVVQRTERLYATPDGDRFAVVFDDGNVALVADRTVREALCEIELELVAGAPAALVRTARTLAQRYPLSLGTRSKAARGYALAAAQDGGAVPVTPAEAIEKAGSSAVLPGMTLTQTYALTLTRCAGQIAGNMDAVVDHRFPEGIHQMRVAMRRLRAAHAAFHKAIPLAGAREHIARVKALFSLLGEARDLDVFYTETLPAMVSASAEAGPGAAPDVTALAAATEELRAEAWTRVLAALKAPAFTELLLQAGDLAAQAEADRGVTGDGRPGEAGMPLADFARARLDKQWDRAVIAHHVLTGLSNEARHDLRKDLKGLRYEAEFFAPLWPASRVKPFMKQLKGLQDEFGAINDAVTAFHMADMAAARIGGDSAARAAGYVGGWYGARAEAAFAHVCALWPAFEASSPFWHAPPLDA